MHGQSIFNVTSLEESEECNAKGIKVALENSVSKVNFKFECRDKEIGMCSDGALVNGAVYNLLVEEFGDHYLGIFCSSHKFEVAINDAFGSSLLNNYTEVYYFFKKSPFPMAKPFHWHPSEKVQEAKWYQVGGGSCCCIGFPP